MHRILQIETGRPASVAGEAKNRGARFRTLTRSATSNTSKTTDIKPTNTIDPTNAAVLPPDLPAATDADAANACLMAGVSASADENEGACENFRLTS
jgi:hypothetical protein